jgi:hypothetical protein
MTLFHVIAITFVFTLTASAVLMLLKRRKTLRPLSRPTLVGDAIPAPLNAWSLSPLATVCPPPHRLSTQHVCLPPPPAQPTLPSFTLTPSALASLIVNANAQSSAEQLLSFLEQANHPSLAGNVNVLVSSAGTSIGSQFPAPYYDPPPPYQSLQDDAASNGIVSSAIVTNRTGGGNAGTYLAPIAFSIASEHLPSNDRKC